MGNGIGYYRLYLGSVRLIQRRKENSFFLFLRCSCFLFLHQGRNLLLFRVHGRQVVLNSEVLELFIVLDVLEILSHFVII